MQLSFKPNPQTLSVSGRGVHTSRITPLNPPDGLGGNNKSSSLPFTRRSQAGYGCRFQLVIGKEIQFPRVYKAIAGGLWVSSETINLVPSPLQGDRRRVVGVVSS
ncbi:MAG: hypothetical protein V7K40_07010 [Nostoc sp.]|uniref:hypothetical protein n=1 Tax=Nostoc sp. TaxID=1180 RepID=UPI002FF9DF74